MLLFNNSDYLTIVEHIDFPFTIFITIKTMFNLSF